MLQRNMDSSRESCWSRFKGADIGDALTGTELQFKGELFQNEILKMQIGHGNKTENTPAKPQQSREQNRVLPAGKSQTYFQQVFNAISQRSTADRRKTKIQFIRHTSTRGDCRDRSQKGSFMLGFRSIVTSRPDHSMNNLHQNNWVRPSSN